MGDFKKLRVWGDACRFADRVEQMAKKLPNPERQWAFDQLVPAAHSIHENIAEGWGFDTDPQKLKYCRQALSSGNECEDELLALERKDLVTGGFSTLPKEARSVCAQLAGLKLRLEESIAKSRKPRSRRQATRRRAEGRQAKPRQAEGRQAEGRQAEGRQAEGRRPRASADGQPPVPGPDGREPSGEQNES
jgi:four helix bundle protein